MNTPKKIWGLLIPSQQQQSKNLLVLMFLGMMLETLGIGLVIPALGLITQKEWFNNNPKLAPYVEQLGGLSHEQLVIFGMLFLFLVYFAKSLFLALLAWVQARFLYGLQSNVSERLYAGYLSQPYTFHLQNNSAQLIRNAIGQVSAMTSVVQQGMVLITETLVLVGISVLLVLVEPVGAIVVIGIFGLIGLLFYRLTRNRLLRWGEERQYHEGKRIQHLQQGLGGVKEVILYGREGDFIDQYRLHNTSSARVGKRHYILQSLPRLWLELLAVGGLALLVIVSIYRGKPLDSLLPTLGLFAAAAFRLMPSANRIIGAIQNIRYAMPVVDTLSSELHSLEKREASAHRKPLPLKHKLELENISFSYPSSERPALRNINISIWHGESVGIIGGSGAGKSSLVDVILGLLEPFSGRIQIDNSDIRKHLRDWQDQIGYVPQSIFLTDDTLCRNIAFGLPDKKIDEKQVWHVIRAAQLESFIDDLPEGINTMVGERGVRLSGGQRQRIGIARALYHDPSVLVLDEATSSLDIETERKVMDAVKALQGDKTIIIVAHRLSTVEHCDKLYRLENGRVVDQGAAEVVLSK